MRHILAFFAIACCAAAQQDAKITYVSTQASVQDIVKTMAQQAGLGYQWQKSFDQTDPQCRQFVHDVRIEAVPFEMAMRQILDPVGLRYEVENGDVVLYRAPYAPPAGLWDRRISYSTGKKSVQYIVIDLAKQVGLGYDWDKSFAQTDPDCTRFVFGLSIKNQPFDKAMARVLKPVKLRYQVENGQVVLYPR
jgi:hypothetical protein